LQFGGDYQSLKTADSGKLFAGTDIPPQVSPRHPCHTVHDAAQHFPVGLRNIVKGIARYIGRY
jgi:hypothetical protein